METTGVDCQAALGRGGRVLAARLMPDQDVVEGILALIKTAGFKSGWVAAIGSLKGARVMWLKKNELSGTIQDNVTYYTMPGPVELGVARGYFGHNQDGELKMHIHGLIMDAEGNMRCGNLQPGSAPVLVTVELTIHELEGVDINFRKDPVLRHEFPHPVEI